MSLINLSVKHGTTLEEARGRLETAVGEIQRNFGALLQQTEWAVDRQSVRIAGTGFDMALRIDCQDVHVVVNVPLLGKLLSQPVVAGVKKIVQEKFQKRLT